MSSCNRVLRRDGSSHITLIERSLQLQYSLANPKEVKMMIDMEMIYQVLDIYKIN